MSQIMEIPDKETLQRRMGQDEADFMAVLAESGFSGEEAADVKKRIDEGEPLYRLLGMAEGEVRERYDLARRFYDSGRLEEAEALFRWLCLYSGSASVNWMGLGAVLQCREQWEPALNAYSMAAYYGGEDDPAPWYYCGICNMQLDREEKAAAAFKEAILRCQPAEPGHADMLSRAAALYKNLGGKVE